ncbi:MAG: hypothetical protein HY557_00050 [Euryarchaeota archaeon]|nr:hypothetical protein [Euryarchaeota archaeon]
MERGKLVRILIVVVAGLVLVGAIPPYPVGAAGDSPERLTVASAASLVGLPLSTDFRSEAAAETAGASPHALLSSVSERPARASPDLTPLDPPFIGNLRVTTDSLPQDRPSMARDSQGRIYVAFEHQSLTSTDVYLAWSDDFGRTWSAPRAVAASASNEGSPSLVVTDGDVLTVFIQQDIAADGFMYVQSTDRGATWRPFLLSTTGAPLSDYRHPSFVGSGSAVYGLHQVWCTASPDCLPGAWTFVLWWDLDITTPGGWTGLYFLARPDLEFFHPVAGFNEMTGQVVGAAEYEIVDNVAWDFFWFRFDLATPALIIDGIMCGDFCPSTEFVWPAVAVDGNSILTAAHFINATATPPITTRTIFAAASVDGGTNFLLVNEAGGGLLDPDSVDQQFVSVEVRGSLMSFAFLKGSAVTFVNSTDAGISVGTSVSVADNAPGTAALVSRAVDIEDIGGEVLAAWHDTRDGDDNIYFAGQKYRVSVDTNPVGLLVRFDGGPLQTTPVTVGFLAGSSHSIEAQATQPGAPGVRYVFANWSDATTTNPRTVLASGDGSFLANFRTQFNTTVATVPTGREVTVDGGMQAGPFQFWCDAGASHTVEAPSPQSLTATSRYRFTGWSDGGAQSHAIACNAPATITASFVLEYRLTLTNDDPAGSGTSAVSQPNPDGWYADGTPVTLVASESVTTSAGDERFVFLRWGTGSTDRIQMVTMTEARTLSVEWTRQVRIRVETNPPLADVQPTIDGVPVPVAGVFLDEGVPVAVRVPSEVVSGGKTYRFEGWAGIPGGAALTYSPSNPEVLVARYREVSAFESPAVIGGLIALIVAALLVAFFLWRRRRGPIAAPPATAGVAPAAPPPPPEMATMDCPSCGMTIEAKPGPCPVCGAQVTPPEDERVRKLEEAYRSGRISEAVYRANLEKLRKK